MLPETGSTGGTALIRIVTVCPFDRLPVVSEATTVNVAEPVPAITGVLKLLVAVVPNKVVPW